MKSEPTMTNADKVATTIFFACIVLTIWYWDPWYLVAGTLLFLGYMFASAFLIEWNDDTGALDDLRKLQ